MPANAVMQERNKKIVEQLSSGARVLDVASAFNLSASRVRAIRSDAARATFAVGANGSNGTGNARPTSEIGLSGLKYSSGWIFEEFIQELNSPARRAQLFNEMRSNDPIVASMLLATELAIRRVDWRIEGDGRRSALIESAWGDLSHSWNDHISEVLTMLTFGWSWFEVVYKRRRGPEMDPASDYNDGRIGWRKFALRSQDSLDQWRFDEHGNVQAMLQRTYPDFVVRTIPLEKSLLYRTSREKNNPEGRSLLRPAYVPYYYAKNLRSIEAIGAERDLAGLPKLTAPTGINLSENSPDLTRAQEMLRRVRQDQEAGVLVQDPWDFDLLGSPGSKQFDVGAIIQRYESRIAMSMLATFLMLGMDKVGTYSLSKNLTDFFALGCTAIADIIGETFSQYAIPRLLRLNGMKLENAPELKHGPLGTPDLEAIEQYVAGLGNANFLHPDVDTEQWLRRQIYAPEVPEIQVKARQEREEQEVVEPTPPPVPPPNGNGAQSGENGQPTANANGKAPAEMKPEPEKVPA